MPFDAQYLRQVQLLMQALPYVSEEENLALKGGSAINLFMRDLPRLSVDIDLIYLPMHARAEALAGIDAAMKRIATAIQSNIPGVRVIRIAKPKAEGAILQLNVTANGVSIKIEIIDVLRGTVYKPAVKQVRPAVEDAFGFAEGRILSFEDLYAGKLVAALDRQHPRDLFDIYDLMRHEGITKELRETFLIYLISHKRPMGEVLSGRCKDMTQLYQTGFVGMTGESITLNTLLDAQQDMISTLIGKMPEHHRRFLLGFERRNPDWSLLHISHARDLPAVRWRERNLDTPNAAKKRAVLVATLEKALERSA